MGILQAREAVVTAAPFWITYSVLDYQPFTFMRHVMKRVLKFQADPSSLWSETLYVWKCTHIWYGMSKPSFCYSYTKLLTSPDIMLRRRFGHSVLMYTCWFIYLTTLSGAQIGYGVIVRLLLNS